MSCAALIAMLLLTACGTPSFHECKSITIERRAVFEATCVPREEGDL